MGISWNIFLSSKKLNIKDVQFNIAHHQSTHYVFNGNVFTLPLFAESHKFIRPGVLQDIKERFDASHNAKRFDPRAGILPNIAEGCIVIHYEENGRPKQKIINL